MCIRDSHDIGQKAAAPTGGQQQKREAHKGGVYAEILGQAAAHAAHHALAARFIQSLSRHSSILLFHRVKAKLRIPAQEIASGENNLNSAHAAFQVEHLSLIHI